MNRPNYTTSGEFGKLHSKYYCIHCWYTEQMLEKARELYMQEMHQFLDYTKTVLVALFCIAFPLIIGIMLVLRPITIQIKVCNFLFAPILTFVLQQENARTVKMLLLLPIDAIEAVPAIKDYLTTGMQQTGTNIKEALMESQERNRYSSSYVTKTHIP